MVKKIHDSIAEGLKTRGGPRKSKIDAVRELFRVRLVSDEDTRGKTLNRVEQTHFVCVRVEV